MAPAVSATSASPGTTHRGGRTTTTYSGTTLPRPGAPTASESPPVEAIGDRSRRDSALCVQARQIAEGPLSRDRVDAARVHLPAAFASLPVEADDVAVQHEASERFGQGLAQLLEAPDAGQGGGRGPVPSPFVWPAGVDRGLGACFVAEPGAAAPLEVRLGPVLARPSDDAGLDTLMYTELTVVDPFGYIDGNGPCAADQVTARRRQFAELVSRTSAAQWAEGMGLLAAEMARACGADVVPVVADGTEGTLVFLAPPGTFVTNPGPNV